MSLRGTEPVVNDLGYPVTGMMVEGCRGIEHASGYILRADSRVSSPSGLDVGLDVLHVDCPLLGDSQIEGIPQPL